HGCTKSDSAIVHQCQDEDQSCRCPFGSCWGHWHELRKIGSKTCRNSGCRTRSRNKKKGPTAKKSPQWDASLRQLNELASGYRHHRTELCIGKCSEQRHDTCKNPDSQGHSDGMYVLRDRAWH